MDELIRRQTSILTLLEKGQKSRRYKLGEIWELNFDEIREALETVPSVDAVEVVRCKDCKYKPTGTGCNHDLEFPVHYKCPCECDDYWYSWMPKDDFFCGNGERKIDG